jgi:hypothetical protein
VTGTTVKAPGSGSIELHSAALSGIALHPGKTGMLALPGVITDESQNRASSIPAAANPALTVVRIRLPTASDRSKWRLQHALLQICNNLSQVSTPYFVVSVLTSRVTPFKRWHRVCIGGI